ncbi:hypothetical protein ACROYT_G020734 [Oculina patagonica]
MLVAPSLQNSALALDGLEAVFATVRDGERRAREKRRKEIRWDPNFSNLQGKRKLVSEIEGSRNRDFTVEYMCAWLLFRSFLEFKPFLHSTINLDPVPSRRSSEPSKVSSHEFSVILNAETDLGKLKL